MPNSQQDTQQQKQPIHSHSSNTSSTNSNGQPPKLEVKNLYKIFGSTPKKALKLSQNNHSKDDIFAKTGNTVAVNDVSLSVYEGEIFVVMGLSGSGKSTLIRLLNRLIEPTSGQVFIDGEDVIQMDNDKLRQTRRNKMSMVFQSFALMPHLTTIQNTGFGLELAGIEEDVRNQRAMHALKQVGLEANANSYPDELSGGMRQRVGLARALANDPDILLMDEAFSALDPLIRTEMQDELLNLQANDKRTIVFISHDLDEAMRIGDRIAIMQDGVVVQVGTPDDILKNPANDYIRSFFKEVDVSQVFTAKDIARPTQLTFIKKVKTQTTEPSPDTPADGQGLHNALKRLHDNDREYGFVLSAQKQFLGVVSAQSVKQVIDTQNVTTDNKKIYTLEDAILPEIKPVAHNTSLRDMYAIIAQTPCPIPVVDENNKYIGSVSYVTLLETLSRN